VAGENRTGGRSDVPHEDRTKKVAVAAAILLLALPELDGLAVPRDPAARSADVGPRALEGAAGRPVLVAARRRRYGHKPVRVKPHRQTVTPRRPRTSPRRATSNLTEVARPATSRPRQLCSGAGEWSSTDGWSQGSDRQVRAIYLFARKRSRLRSTWCRSGRTTGKKCLRTSFPTGRPNPVT